MRTIRRALLLTLLAVGSASADMRIELADGRKLTVPIEREDIVRITIDNVPVHIVEGEAPSVSLANSQIETHTDDETGRRILRVGQNRALRLPSEAAAVAEDGDIVEIDAGLYRGDVAGWPQSDLIIRSVGGRAHVNAEGRGYGGKALWVVSGDNVTIEGMELSNCVVPDHNCAAVRAEGSDLTLHGVHFHGNQMGVLTAGHFRGTLLVERSELNDNIVDHERFGVQPAHNVYMSGGDRLVVRGSYLHSLRAGHNIKSRAAESIILFNRIEDGPTGSSSYHIDISDGGRAIIVGNLITQGPEAENASIIAFGMEGTHRDQILDIAHNTLINQRGTGVFINNNAPVVARLTNNLLVGPGEPVVGASDHAGNTRVVELGHYPLQGSVPPAVDGGVLPGTVPGFDAAPQWQYRHPMQLVPRPMDGGAPDSGAYEIGPSAAG